MMTGTKRSGSKGVMQFGTTTIVLSGIALATVSIPAVFAAGKPLPIEKIGLDNSRQLVVQFTNEPGAFPPVPNVLDLPGPNHRMVVEFVDATIDRAKIPTAEDMTRAMRQVLPQVKAIRYSLLPNSAKPTARIVLELPEDLKISARVVKMEEDTVTVNLGEAVRDLVIEKKAPTRRLPGTSAVPGGQTLASANSDDTTASAISGGAPVPDESSVQSAAPVAQVPAVVAQAPAQSTFQIAPPAAAPAVQTYGQTTVSADGETIALKPEQKIEQPKAPVLSTKSGANPPAWDWNSSMDNELASKIAETKSMGDGGPMPVANNKLDGDEQALINKVAKSEGGAIPAVVAAPVAQLREAPISTPVSATAEAPEATPAVRPVQVQEAPAAVRSVPVQEVPLAQAEAPMTPAKEPETTPEPESTAPVPAVAQMAQATTVAQAPPEAPKTEVIETQPLDVPSSAAIPATPPAATASAAPAASSTGAAEGLKLYNSAVKNHLTGKLTDAINDYKGAIAANPEMAEAHSNLGLIYNQQHNYEGALSEFRKALAINPRDAITYNGIGAALRAEKDLPGAIKNWQTAVDIDPKLATAHYNLGTAYEIQKDYDKALGAYADAVKNDFRLGEAFYRMGLILQQKHQFQDAEANYKQALKINATAEYCDDAKSRIAALSAQKK